MNFIIHKILVQIHRILNLDLFLKNIVDSKGITISFATRSNAGVVQW